MIKLNVVYMQLMCDHSYVAFDETFVTDMGISYMRLESYRCVFLRFLEPQTAEDKITNIPSGISAASPYAFSKPKEGSGRQGVTLRVAARRAKMSLR